MWLSVWVGVVGVPVQVRTKGGLLSKERAAVDFLQFKRGLLIIAMHQMPSATAKAAYVGHPRC